MTSHRMILSMCRIHLLFPNFNENAIKLVIEFSNYKNKSPSLTINVTLNVVAQLKAGDISIKTSLNT